MAATSRLMTEAERETLAKGLKIEKCIQRRPFGEFLLMGFSLLLPCMLVSVAWIFALWLFGVLERASDWNETPAGFWGVTLLCTAILIWGFLELRKDSKRVKGRIARLEADMAAGIVVADQMTVVDAKGAMEPEHLARMYFLLGADGRVFTIYDYDSPDMEGRGRAKQTKLRFAKELSIFSFPISGEVNYSFSGKPLRKPRAVTMNSNPKDWPEPEAFWDVAWEDIDAKLNLSP